MRNSPTALRLLKSAMNAVEDGQSGLQQLGGDATMLFYNSEEGNEVQFLPVKSTPGIQMLIIALNHRDIHFDAVQSDNEVCTPTSVLHNVSLCSVLLHSGSPMGSMTKRKASEHSVFCLSVHVNLWCIH